jgi:hypothetical protein
MPTLLCLDGYTWLNLDLVTQIQYAGGGWHVRLSGDATFLPLTSEQGAMLAAWVRAHGPARSGAPGPEVWARLGVDMATPPGGEEPPDQAASPRPVAPRRRIRPPVHG